jgi:flagellar protein FliS
VIDPIADRYLIEKVNSATPAELTAMLYDKAVVSLKRAQVFLAAGQHEAARARIVNASDVVLELRGSLNPAAGDMTVRLGALYAWVTTCLLMAMSRRDSNLIQNALDVLQPLQEAWRESCVGAPAGVASSAMAAVPAPR